MANPAATLPHADLGQALGGGHRGGPLDGVEVRVDPCDGPLDADDTGHRDHGGTGAAADVDDMGTGVMLASCHSSDSSSRARSAIPR